MSTKTVLILGAGGMLGHKLAQILPGMGYSTWATVRGPAERFSEYGIEGISGVIGGVNAGRMETVRYAVSNTRPDFVINAIGVVKQKKAAADPATMIEINSLFPHRLFEVCAEEGARLVTIGTDCVFSGRAGNYNEQDPADGQDLYGKSKALGEIDRPGSVTLRTSIIGRELQSSHGLLEWFISNRGGTVKGFLKAFFSGFTTIELARIIGEVVIPTEGLNGIYHVSAARISKFDLLEAINQSLDLGITIVRDEEVTIDRSLNSERFENETGYEPPSWKEMIRELAEDPTPYEQWRKEFI